MRAWALFEGAAYYQRVWGDLLYSVQTGTPASTQVLGARPVDINARPGVLLVLPGDTPGDLAVFAVALNCSAADTGLLANTQVPRT